MIRSKKPPSGRECNHPTCGSTCRRPKKERVIHQIKPFSEKRQDLQDEYQPIAEKFCYDHPECKIQSPECTYWTQGVHHPKGKVGFDEDGTPLLIAVKHFIPACNTCNDYVEKHHQWARERGFKIIHVPRGTVE